MAVDASPLFRALDIGGKRLPNRIVMPPMAQVRSLTSPEGVDWYGSHARGGVGLVIVEGTGVTRFGADLTPASLGPLVQAIHDGGALAAIQLFPSTRRPVQAPADLTADEIERMVADFERASAIAIAAGFDGVQPHGAHGYLLNRFFSPEQNLRADEFGGSLEGRMRLALAITAASRRGAGAGAFLSYRHTPVGQGYGMDDSLLLAERLVGAGVDVLDISPSSVMAPGDHAAPFMRFGVPVVATNLLDKVDSAVTVLNEGRADLVAIGRGLIADPEWANKVRDGRFGAIVPCSRCNRKCYGNLDAGLPVECVHWAQ